MKKSSVKYYLGIACIFFMNTLKNVFFSSDLKLDVYLFYNHARYVDNILYDLNNLFVFSLLTYWLIELNRKTFIPLFITSIVSWIFYFLFYCGMLNLLIIPLYVITTFIYNKKLLLK